MAGKMLGEVTFKRDLIIEVHSCWNCGIEYGLTEAFANSKRSDHSTFYCPNGHSTGFLAETKEEKLAKQLKRTQDALADERQWGAEQSALRKAEERRHSATKGLLTKAKKRAANGVCLACHRHFVNVERHMASRHPGFAAEAE